MVRRALCFLLLVGTLWAEPDSLIPADPNTLNAFARANPGYRYRAATSYEKSYFPQALDQLCRQAEFPESVRPLLRSILQGFIYRWLDRYVVRGGSMSQADLSEIVGWLDGQVRQHFSQREFDGYQRWQESPDNSLAFLFHVHPPAEAPRPSRPEDRF